MVKTWSLPLGISWLTAVLWLWMPLGGLAQQPADLLAAGDRCLVREKTDSAEVYYQAALAIAGPDKQLVALAKLARVALRRTDLRAADSLLQLGEPLLAHPKTTPLARGEFRLSRGEYYREASELEAALNEYRRLADRTTGRNELAHLRGYALLYTALTFERLAVYDSSLYYAERAYPVLCTVLDTNALEFSAIYNGLGVTYFRANHLAEAERFFLRSKALAERHLGPRSQDVAICLNNLSAISRSAENYPEAIAYAEQALAIYRSLADESGAAGALYSLGVYHYFQGDYGRTKDYITACIAIRERLYGPEHYSLNGPYQLLGIVYESSGTYDETLRYLRKARRTIVANYPPGSIPEGFNYENTAICFVSMGQLDSALHYIRLANRLLPGQLPENDYALATHYYSYANIHYERGEWAAAADRLEASDRIFLALGMDRSFEYAGNLALGALIYAAREAWLRADEQFAAALDRVRLPEPELAFQLSPNTLEILNEYTGYLYRKYAATGDPTALAAFSAYSERYLQLSDRFRRQFIDPYTKSVLSKDNAEVYGRNVGIYYQLFRETGQPEYLQSAYRFSEYGRTCQLRDLQDEKIRSYAGIPDSVLQRERQLKKEMAERNRQVLENPDSDSLLQLLFQGKEKLSTHLTRTLETYPRYFDLKYNELVPELSEIQARLTPGHDLIEYVQDDTAYYALLITSRDADLFHLGDRRTVDAAIRTWQRQLLDRVPVGSSVVGQLLYRTLWQPLRDQLSGDRVTIVPVGPLFYLNFETLPTGNPRRPYLIYDYQFDYALSFTVQFSTAASSSAGPLLAIAPGFEEALKTAYRAGLDSLAQPDEDYLRTVRQPWSLRLVRELEERYQHHSLTGAQATESNVKAGIQAGKVLFFGSHAIADPLDPLRSKLVLAKEPGEPLEDGYLHAYEIYGLPLQADLAVLSACESGVGEVRKGEGMISLAYSIHFAGCPATVMSLWKVDEKVNTRIVGDFLAYLETGLKTGAALRRAKLDYLDRADARMQHPFYWGGMVLMGKDQSVRLVRRRSRGLLLGAGGLLVLGLAYAGYRWWGKGVTAQ